MFEIVKAICWLQKNPWMRYVGCRKNRARCFGCRITLGTLRWLRKNPGRAVVAPDKHWARCIGCGKTLGAILAAEKLGRVLFGLQKSTCVHAFCKFDIQTLYF